MTPIRKAAFAALFLFSLAWLGGCGDVIRPIATPIIQPGGDPSEAHQAQIITSASGADGFVTHINISGDTNVGQVPVGRDPVYLATINAGTRTYVVNRSDATLSVYSTFNPIAAAPTVITMPPGSLPSFIATSGSSLVYVALTGHNAAGVVDPILNLFAAEIPVGTSPVALGFNGDGSKVYVVNRDSNTVSVITSVDRQVVDTIPVGTKPVYIVMSSNGAYAFVVNHDSNNVSVIDTSTDTVVKTVAVGPGPNFAFFDSHALRVYITNQGCTTANDLASGCTGSTLSVIAANSQVTDGTFLSVTSLGVGDAPSSVTALPSGTRIYVANAKSNNVTVISAQNVATCAGSQCAAQKIIPVGTNPISLGASPDSIKVVVANQGSNNASSIRTSDDTVAVTLPLPQKPVVVLMTR